MRPAHNCGFVMDLPQHTKCTCIITNNCEGELCMVICRSFWSGSHAIPLQRCLIFTKIIIPQNYKLGCIFADFHFFFYQIKIASTNSTIVLPWSVSNTYCIHCLTYALSFPAMLSLLVFISLFLSVLNILCFPMWHAQTHFIFFLFPYQPLSLSFFLSFFLA